MKTKKKPTRPTIKDISEKAGVTPATVSLVLNNKETSRASQATKEKIYQIARELNYRPNIAARSLVIDETKNIGLVSPNLFHPFYAELAHDVVARAKEKGYGVLAKTVQNHIGDEKETLQDEREALQDLLDRGVDGLIVCSALRQDTAVLEVARQNRPIVQIMRETEPSGDIRAIDYVGVDNYLGGHMAVEHLIEHGHRRIALIMGNQNISTGYGRYQGALEAMKVQGITHNKKLTRFGGFDRKSGYHLMSDILKGKNHPTAVFAASDTIAVGVVTALREKGFRVPENVALIGFDDTTLASIPGFDLTTISQQKFIMGKLGVDYLVDKINGKDRNLINRRILTPELVIRFSCGCEPSKSD